MDEIAAVVDTPRPFRLPDLPVERRKASELPYDRYLRDYVANHRPVVVEGAGAHWPAATKWTPDYFKARFGAKVVDISFRERMRFDDFIDGILASTEERPGPYMFRFFICVHLPELLGDLDDSNPYSFSRRLGSPLMPRRYRRPDGYLKLLIGGVGGRFPVMHFDGEDMHAAVSEIYGDKEFILYAPTDSPYMYPKPEQPNHTRIADLADPDYGQFPLFAQAQRYRTVLTPGDTIFVPSRWWHTARVLTPSVSVCTNMIDGSNWGGFVREVCGPLAGGSSLRRAIKRGVLTALGGALTVFERLGRRDGALPSVLSTRMGHLSPWSPAEALPPASWPMQRWTVDSG
jgi:Cupin-like domain